ncbi:MAG: hypothetical protein NWE93_11390 [Candidatus Bathyarchaeota archaeon]|nr:hypothetical protein [Candidatus Bathyarchaeota archaeon]
MTEQKSLTPLRVGLLAAAASYFIFTFHAMFTLSWIGEWESSGGYFGFVLLVEDISATIGLVFRFIASIIALVAVIMYLYKKIPQSKAIKMLQVIVVFEGIYWLGLIATAGFNTIFFGSILSRGGSLAAVLDSLLLSVIPTVFESIILPISLFIFAYKLSPKKPLRGAIKWGAITGALYVLVFWMINSSIWIGVVEAKGTEYLTAYPEHLVSFATTTIGLAMLSVAAIYFAKKASAKNSLDELGPKAVGSIVLALGAYFLWNYLSWVIFAGATWNDWYAWFLGHNMDLWLLVLPLVGLPLLFHAKPPRQAAGERQQTAT